MPSPEEVSHTMAEETLKLYAGCRAAAYNRLMHDLHHLHRDATWKLKHSYLLALIELNRPEDEA